MRMKMKAASRRRFEIAVILSAACSLLCSSPDNREWGWGANGQNSVTCSLWP
jgi:hypothetical protein